MTPEQRQARTEQLQQAIHGGTYHVPSEAVADAILRDINAAPSSFLTTPCGELEDWQRDLIQNVWTRNNREAARNIEREAEWRRKRAALDRDDFRQDAGMVPPALIDPPTFGDSDDGEGRNWSQADERWATVIDWCFAVALSLSAILLLLLLLRGKLL